MLERVPAEEVGVSVRDAGSATSLAECGVRVREGDFTDPSTLERAFDGADRVLVISAAIRGDGATAANVAAIDAVRAAGASRILYTSHQASSPDSLFAPRLTHAATEAHLAGLGAPFTSLRNGFYVSTLATYLGEALETGRLALPEDGPVSWTAHDDLADAAVVALTEPGVLDGVTAPLTAPEALDLAAVADALGDVTGQRIDRVVVDDEQWVASAVERGMPAAAAEFTLGMFRAARRGEFAVTDPTLERILGRPATSVRSFLEETYGRSARVSASASSSSSPGSTAAWRTDSRQ